MNDLTPLSTHDAQRGEVIDSTCTEVPDPQPKKARTKPASAQELIERLRSDEDIEVNDARVSGVSTPEWNALLDRPMTFLLPKNKNKDARQTDWKNGTSTFAYWLVGGPDGALSRHLRKASKGFFPLVFGGAAKIEGWTRRTANGMKTIDCLVLDSDAGDSLFDVKDRLAALGLAALLYTSYSDQKSVSHFPHDKVLRHLRIDRDPTDDEMRAFLAGKFRDHVLSTISVAGTEHTEDGLQIIVTHTPIEKFRVIVPLAEVLEIMSLAGASGTQKAAQLAVAQKVRGLAKLIGLKLDESCTDVSRAFYMPSHPQGAEWELEILRGRGVTLEELEDVAKDMGQPSHRTRKRDDRTLCGMPLEMYAAIYAHRLELARLLEDHCPERVREVKGSVLVSECPHDEWHSNAGSADDRGFHVSDADYLEQRGFVAKCKHDSCQTLDRLDQVYKMVQDGWFPEDLLISSDYLTPLSDEEMEEEADLIDDDEDVGSGHSTRAELSGSVREALLAKTEGFSEKTDDSEVRKVIAKAIKDGADHSAMDALKEAIASKTRIKARPFEKLRKEEEGKLRRKKRKSESAKSGIPAMDVTSDFSAMCTYAEERIHAANVAEPFLFNYMDEFAVIDQKTEKRDARIRVICAGTLFAELSDITNWEKTNYSGETPTTTEVATPAKVMEYIENSRAVRDALPTLVALKTSPFFALDGTLVSEEGYHAETQSYLCLGDLVLPPVSAVPTEEEVTEAKRLLVEEVLADMPLNGKTRSEIMDALTGSALPALANALALILLPFAREMIPGPTPFHLLNKPAPGTGAGFLADVTSIIGTGAATAPATLPASKEETAKTLTSVLMDGGQIIFFDNINHAVDSAELAAVGTAPPEGYKARILGKSQTVRTPIRQVWIFTANALVLSGELLRRSVLIDLDRKVAKPENYLPEGGWHHANFRQWVRDNRAILVWACLTLIQNWVAKGMVHQSEVRMGSYEEWVGVMGGILKAANVNGFLGNTAYLAEMSDGGNDDLTNLAQEIVDVMGGTLPKGRLYVGERTPAQIKDNQFSVIDILNAMSSPLRLEGWGYNEGPHGDVTYVNARKVGNRFKAAAMRTYAVQVDGTTRNLGFEAENDAASKVRRYRLVLKD